MRMDENDSFFKLKEQLEDAQKLMGRMEQYIVEARGVLQSCIRRQSEFQYAYLGDMIQETAKTSERLTDDETLPLARVRDHDNYEEKHVQDIITNFFLQSDSGLYTNTCHVTRMGEEDRTLLYVMDSSKFPAWISDFGKETGIEKNHE